MSRAWSCCPEPRPHGNHEARAPTHVRPTEQKRGVSFHVLGQLSRSAHVTFCERSWFWAPALPLPPSLPHKYIDIYLYIFKCISTYTYVYIYICIFKFGLGVDSGSQPLSAKKKKNLSWAHPLITKPHAQSPIHELPYQKKNIILFKRKNKNATLSPSNSTTPSLSFSL